jgi:acetyl-CoA synthetase
MPMTPEICIALLAIAKIGGIILPLFSGYGSSAIASRLADAGAKALFTADGLLRRGQVVPLKAVADQAISDVPSLKHLIVLKRCCNRCLDATRAGLLVARVDSQQPSDASLEPTRAEDVLMIIYTSGTTGKPKGAVHTHCSFPVKAAQDMAFGTDVQGR